MADTTNIKFRKIISFNSFTLLYGTFSYIFPIFFTVDSLIHSV